MDINFLSEEEKKDKPSREQKGKSILNREIKWSSSEKSEKKEGPPKSPGEKKGIKSYLPDFFNADFFNTSFLRKKKEKAGPVYQNNLANGAKLRQSRKELLKFIGEQKKAVEVRPAVGKETEEVKVSLIKKRRLEIWPKMAKLFKPVVAIFKKIGRKTGASVRQEGKEQSQEQLSEKEKTGNQRQGQRGSEVGGTGKGVTPELIQAKDKKEEEGAEILETNLIKGEITVFFNWQKNVIVLIIAMISAALAVGAVYGLLSWQGSQKEKEGQYFVERFSELDKEIAKVEVEAQKVLAFKKKLSLVNSLLDQHIYWTNFFKFLEENTLADVYFAGFSGDTKGKYDLMAGGKDYTVIEDQVKRFLASKYVSEASVDQAIISATDKKKASVAGEVAFGLKLVIDPAIFTSSK